MSKSERGKQKKADAQKRQERRRAKKAKQKARTHAILAKARENADAYKDILRSRGCDWKFYEYLDSYTDAFERESARAKNDCSSLLGVFEIDDADYQEPDRESLAARLGFLGLKQIFFSSEDVGDDYPDGVGLENIAGCTVAYRDESGQLKTLVLLRDKAFHVSNVEVNNACKLIALFHELGHVVDWQRSKNLHEGQVAMLEAESFAHEYALKRLLAGDYRKALAIYLAAIDVMLEADDYRKTVAQRVLQTELAGKCRRHAAENWTELIRSEQRRKPLGLSVLFI